MIKETKKNSAVGLQSSAFTRVLVMQDLERTFQTDRFGLHPIVARQVLRQSMKRFHGGLVVEAHRLLYHSTLGSRVLIKKKKVQRFFRSEGPERNPFSFTALRPTREKNRSSPKDSRGPEEKNLPQSPPNVKRAAISVCQFVIPKGSARIAPVLALHAATLITLTSCPQQFSTKHRKHDHCRAHVADGLSRPDSGLVFEAKVPRTFQVGTSWFELVPLGSSWSLLVQVGPCWFGSGHTHLEPPPRARCPNRVERRAIREH